MDLRDFENVEFQHFCLKNIHSGRVVVCFTLDPYFLHERVHGSLGAAMEGQML